MLRRIPWWGWLLLALPGGFILVPLLARKRGGAPTTDGSNEAMAKKRNLEGLIASAHEQANTLRQGLKGDPLAAQLIGVNPDAVNASQPEVQADNAEAQANVQRLTDRISYEQGRYGIDHNGGQSEGEFAQRIASLQAERDSWLAKLR